MQWTKIPTNLLINRLSDQEIVAIVKYQLLWADLEYQPDDKTALRYLSNKQLTIAMQWLNAIDTQVTRDIRSSEMNRNSVKLNYLKNKDKSENLSISLNNSLNNSLDEQIRLNKIREDKNKEIYKENFEEWWSYYPKLRAGSKKKAYVKYKQAITEDKLTPEFLLSKVKEYAESDEVKKGFACGAEVYFNKCKYNNQYNTGSDMDYLEKSLRELGL